MARANRRRFVDEPGVDAVQRVRQRLDRLGAFGRLRVAALEEVDEDAVGRGEEAVAGLADALHEPIEAVDLGDALLEAAQLEEAVDQPDPRPHLQIEVGAALGELHGPGDGDGPLGHAGGRPEHGGAGDEGGGQQPFVAGALRQGDGLGDELVPGGRIGVVVAGDGQRREQLDPPGDVRLDLERLLQQPGQRLVHEAELEPDAGRLRRGRLQPGPPEDVRVAVPAGYLGGSVDGLARLLELA